MAVKKTATVHSRAVPPQVRYSASRSQAKSSGTRASTESDEIVDSTRGCHRRRASSGRAEAARTPRTNGPILTVVRSSTRISGSGPASMWKRHQVKSR